MNSSDLYNLLLPLVQANPIIIDLTQFDSPAINAVLPYFQGQDLQVNSPDISNFSESNMSFSGLGGSLPFPNMNLEVLFYVENEEAQLTILGTGIPSGDPGNTDGSNNFSLATCFPPLSTSVLNEISYGQTSSLSLTTNPQGFEVDGSMALEGILAPLALLIGSSMQPMQGPITMTGGLPVASLTGPVNSNVPFGFFDALPQISLTVDASSKYNSFQQGYMSTGSLGMVADLSFSLDLGGQTTTYQIPIGARSFNNPTAVQFFGEPDGLIQAGLDYFSYFVDGSSFGEAIAGALFQINNFLQINSVSLIADVSSGLSIQSSTISLMNRSPWVFLRNSDGSSMLSVDEFELSFKYTPGNDSPVSAQISGSIPITETGNLHINTSFPDFGFYVGIDDEDFINLPELFDVFFNLNGQLIPDLTVTKFWISGNPSVGDFAGELELSGTWILPPTQFGLGLDNLYFEVERSGTEAASTCQIKAEFLIGGIHLELDADYPGPGEGWTFSGSTPVGQNIPLGTFISNLASSFGDITLPAPLAGLTLKNLAVDYNTTTQNYHLSGEADFPIGDSTIQLIVKIDHEQLSTGGYETTFRGTFIFAYVDENNSDNDFSLEFDVVFDDSPGVDTFLAVYSNTDFSRVSIRNLVSLVTTDSTVLNAIPEGLVIELYDALFGIQVSGGTTKLIFGLDWGLGVNLTNLPLVGKMFSPDETLQMAYQVLFATGNGLTTGQDCFSVSDIQALNALLPPNTITLPAQAIPANSVELSSTFRLGEDTVQLELPVAVNSSGDLQQTSTPSTEPSNIHWFDVQKTFGPVYFSRVGLGLINSEIWFSLDASLTTAGLTLSLDGLAVSTPIDNLSPSFHLDGLGVDFSEGGLEIGGALLAKDGIYSGSAVIALEDFRLSVMGSYTDLGGDPSMFLYGFLGVPLGGPPFLFVTGLSAGFGFNRSLQLPPLAQIDQFPFVAEAITGTGNSDLMDELKSLSTYIKPEVGVYWAAAGIRVTSFKLLDTFVMATVEVGKKFEVNLTGISSLMFPPEPGLVRPLAELQLAVLATIDPLEGFLGVSAQLTENSYIFHPSLKLTGGFALYTWLFGEHGGDFVVSLGGYHPEFQIPSHYPQVPRLGFDWEVDHHLSFKGGTYFALTPGYLMAGMELHANWDSGDLKAWFDSYLDFIIGFKPFTYDTRAHVDVGASYTFDEWGIRKTFSYEVGADLHIWGPDVSGTAEIDLGIISFEVAFGDSGKTAVEGIAWTDFRDSFLPETNSVLKINVTEGLARTLDTGEVILAPPAVEIQLNSAIPVTSPTQLTVSGNGGAQTWDPIESGANRSVGIAPMDLSDYTGSLKITFKKDGTAISSPFSLEPILTEVPSGLWGTSVEKNLKDDLLVSNVLTGFKLVPMDSGSHDSTQVISGDKLAYEETIVNGAFTFQATTRSSPTSDPSNISTINSTIVNSTAATTREGLLANLGVETPVDLTGTLADEFWTAPLIINS